MSGELTTIKSAYENEGMTPEQIADDRGLDLSAVKAGLMQCSSQYRKACGKEDENDESHNFTKDELRRVNEVIFDTAVGAEDPHLRFKAATYVRDDFKGRKEIVRGVAGQNINILTINQRLQQVRNMASDITSQALNSMPKKIINAS